MDKDKDRKIETENQVSVDVSNKSPGIASFFEKDVDFVFIYKKTEKLVTAFYLVTNFFSDNEPMKWALRKKAGDILSFILGYKDMFLSQHKDFSDNIKTKVLELISLLGIASRSGLVSSMNFSILEQEFVNLIKTIDSQAILNKELQANNLSKSFFYVPAPEASLQRDGRNIGGNEIYESPRTVPKVLDNYIKDTNIITDKSPLKKTNRQNLIIVLLKKKNNLNIKDISQVIKGCSEKTIQRELISLILSGAVKKTGERRWSRYSLSQ